MARESTYSKVEDIALGDLPLPPYIDQTQYVEDASDEVDSIIGFRYKTPVVIPDEVDGKPNQTAHAARLLLKRVARNIASGRILMAIATTSEDVAVHAYAVRLLREANDVLRQIAAGTVDLAGAPLIDVEEDAQHVPIIRNLDPVSLVESFYTFAHPGTTRGFGDA